MSPAVFMVTDPPAEVTQQVVTFWLTVSDNFKPFSDSFVPICPVVAKSLFPDFL